MKKGRIRNVSRGSVVYVQCSHVSYNGTNGFSSVLPLKEGDELQKQYGSSDTPAQPPHPSPARKWWSPLWWYRNPPPVGKWWASLLSCLMFWKRKGPPPDRVIYINDPVRNGGQFCSNRIRCVNLIHGYKHSDANVHSVSSDSCIKCFLVTVKHSLRFLGIHGVLWSNLYKLPVELAAISW